MTATIIDFAERGCAETSEMPTGIDRETKTELRRARARIAELERDLARAMSDSLAHFERARTAERRVSELEAELADRD